MAENTQQNQYQPSAISPPGETIGELLEERSVRQTELATRMGVTPKFVNELIAGKASITPNTALALERALDVPAAFWLGREAKYQEARARESAYENLTASVSWLEELPIRDMCKYGWIAEQGDRPAMVEACLKFFGVATVSAWRQQYVVQTNASAAYRSSTGPQASPGAVAAWLRAGELCATKIVCEPFDRDRFQKVLGQVRQLTVESDPEKFLPALTGLFSSCGVAFVLVRAPAHCPIYGAVRWLSPSKAIIQLSFRYLQGDSFWFSLFHECGHIILHGKKILFLETKEMTGTEEDEANQFAADRLIPAAEWARFSSNSVTEGAIREFAILMGIHPGIVLGRLQKEKRVAWNRFRNLKASYKWKEQ